MEAASPQGDRGLRAAAGHLTDMWWLYVIAGVAWLVIAYVVLQFDEASVRTVGTLIGIMFLVSGFQQFMLGAFLERGALLFWFFGLLFVIAGVVALIQPEETFAGVADVLGFLFLIVGIFWLIQAFEGRAAGYELWWLGLISALLMLVLAFWTSGQFETTKAYTLLVFAGIWALMHGVNDIVAGLALRRLRSS